MALGAQSPVLEPALLLEEIRSLRAELKTLGRDSPKPHSVGEAHRPAMKFALDRAVGERKPFVLRCQGVFDFELRLSTMRAALFLALLLDLHDRSVSNGDSSNAISRMIEAYRMLEGTDAPADQVAALIRVGLYRLELSLVESPLFNSSEFSLTYNSHRHRFELGNAPRSLTLADLAISLSSSDPKILSIVDTLSEISPLHRARQQNSMYISSAEKGWDQLFLEFFDHKEPVRNTSLYYRPALVTFPEELLKRMDASGATLARKRVMLEGYRSGRVEMNEMLTRQTLWDMITQTPDGHFKFYPKDVTSDLVEAHLEEILRHIETFEHYHLSLTDAVFPFIVGVVEIGARTKPEYFSMFYRTPHAYNAGDITCFVLHDPLVAQSVLSRVIGTVYRHPSTSSDRGEIKRDVTRVLEHLRASGPLVS